MFSVMRVRNSSAFNPHVAWIRVKKKGSDGGKEGDKDVT
jgi:hypothetical protein